MNQKYWASIRSIDSGWHHRLVNKVEMIMEIKRHVHWRKFTGQIAAQSNERAPTHHIVAICLEEEPPLSPENVLEIVNEPSACAFFTESVVKQLSISGYSGLDFSTGVGLHKLKEIENKIDEKDPLVELILNRTGNENLIKYISDFQTWDGLVNKCNSKWKRLFEHSNLQFSTNAGSLIPGIHATNLPIKFGMQNIGSETVRALLEIGRRQTILALKENLSEIKLADTDAPSKFELISLNLPNEIQHSFKTISKELSINCWDSLCLQERHFNEEIRTKISLTIDKIFLRSYLPIISASPQIRSKKIINFQVSAMVERYVRKLDLCVYGDLGGLSIGLRTAQNCSDKKTLANAAEYINFMANDDGINWKLNSINLINDIRELKITAEQKSEKKIINKINHDDTQTSFLPKRRVGRPRKNKLKENVGYEKIDLKNKNSNDQISAGINKNRISKEIIFINEDICQAIEFDLRQMSEVQSQVIRYRMGYKVPAITLEQIALALGGKTRERIRQIETEAIKQLKNTRYIYSLGIESIIDAIQLQAKPIRISDLIKIAPKLCVNNFTEACFKYLHKNWSRDLIQFLEVENKNNFIATYTVESLSALSIKLNEHSSPFNLNFTEWDTKARQLDFFGNIPVDIADILIRGAFDPNSCYKEILQFTEPKTADLVKKTLAESNVSMSVIMVKKSIAEKFMKECEPRRIHQILIECAFPLGKTYFGLEKHLGKSVQNLKDMASAVDEVFAKYNATEFRILNIIKELKQTKYSDMASLYDKFQLAACLRLYSRTFLYANRLTFTRTIEKRSIIREHIENFIESEGCACDTSLITNYIKKIFPHVTFQVRATNKIARISDKKWGLRNRDFKLDKEQLDKILLWLLNLIKTSGPQKKENLQNCPAFKEAIGIDARVTIWTIADLAAATRRFRLDNQGLIRLSAKF